MYHLATRYTTKNKSKKTRAWVFTTTCLYWFAITWCWPTIA